jgi:hypothetical protein
MGAQFVLNVPWAWRSFWAHPMLLVGDVCQVEARFYPFGDGVHLGARKVRFAPNVPRAWKSFEARPMVLLGDIGQVEACFRPFGVVLILTQDRCTVCAECTTGMEIFSGTPDGTSR